MASVASLSFFILTLIVLSLGDPGGPNNNNGKNDNNNDGGQQSGSGESTLVTQKNMLIDLQNVVQDAHSEFEQIIKSTSFDDLNATRLLIIEGMALVTTLEGYQQGGNQQSISSTLKAVQSTLNGLDNMLTYMIGLRYTLQDLESVSSSVATIQAQVSTELQASYAFKPAKSPSKNN